MLCYVMLCYGKGAQILSTPVDAISGARIKNRGISLTFPRLVLKDIKVGRFHFSTSEVSKLRIVGTNKYDKSLKFYIYTLKYELLTSGPFRGAARGP